MAVFFHVDRRLEIQPGTTLGLPISPATHPADADPHLQEIYTYLPGLSRFGYAFVFGTDPENLECKREQILETIRAKFFPQRPSRLASFFGVDNLEDARHFKQVWPVPGMGPARIWRVECMAHFRGDMRLFEDILANHEAGFRYWKQESTRFPFWEYLLTPPVQVLERVE